MFNQAQEAHDSDFNSRYDDQAERYASTALDPYYEAYCDFEGDDTISFEEFKAAAKAQEEAVRFRSRIAAPVIYAFASDDDSPF